MAFLMNQAEHSNAARQARKTAKRLSDATLELTGPARVRPDFLIVGAQRCGTTTMFKTLVQHPDVVRPFLRKGVHYFDKSYWRGERWYRGHFPLTVTTKLRGRGHRVLTGESSPYYMFHPLARQRLASDLPGVKLLVLLRDPVVRAYSAHSHEQARGFEDLEFEAAVEAEAGRIAGERERLHVRPWVRQLPLAAPRLRDPRPVHRAAARARAAGRTRAHVRRRQRRLLRQPRTGLRRGPASSSGWRRARTSSSSSTTPGSDHRWATSCASG